MAESGYSIVQEGGGADRISNLPRNVLHHILEFMSTRDVVRTSILSSKWRYVWTDHPKLEMDKQLFEEVLKKRSPYVVSHFLANLIHRILLQHIGPILKFVLDSSRVPGADIDLWLLVLSQKGVRELTLDNSSCGDGSVSARYELSSHIFSYCELTFLAINNCILKVPSKFKGFSKLNKLILEDIVLGSFLLRTPLLVYLDLRCCSDVRNFNVVAPILEVLHLEANDDLELSYYAICQKLRIVYVEHHPFQPRAEGKRIITLIELLACWPRLSELSIGGLSFENLCRGTVPERLPIILNHFRCLTLNNVYFNLDQIAWVLCIIRSSPILQELQIWGCSFPIDDVKVFDYLGEPGCMNQSMERLRIVRLMDFKGSRAEMQFVRLLLSRSPSLERMFVLEDTRLDLSERMRIMKEILRFSRASTKAELISGHV